MLHYNPALQHNARTLCKTMTSAEILLWSCLKSKQLKGHQFYRQKTIGCYIVDFYCPTAKLVVELDGGQHYSAEGQQKDITRDLFMKNHRLSVMRFSNTEVLKDLKVVVAAIWDKLLGMLWRLQSAVYPLNPLPCGTPFF
jgi:very-short-patch-repair endonuclease